MIRKILPLLLLALLVMATVASAHSVWIESNNGKLLIRFAEPGDSFETSPGYLDNLSFPLAFTVVTNAPAVVETAKKHDSFELGDASPTNIACVETSFTVRGGRKPIFYARWQPSMASAAKPLLTLDLVPTGKAGEVRAYFRGEPIGNVGATLRTPDGKDQELTADAEGFLHFEGKPTGQYLLTIAHYREQLAGFHAGQPYKETSHNAALTWQQP
jgi:hypothetical protein